MTSELHKVQTDERSGKVDSYIEFESEQSVGQKAGDIWNQQQPVCLYIESMQEPGNNERMHFP